MVEISMPNSTYWLAEIIIACGQLLGLRYIDDEYQPREMEDDEDEEDEDKDLRCDVWMDAFQGEVHPLGWCVANGKTLSPPQCKSLGMRNYFTLTKINDLTCK